MRDKLYFISDAHLGTGADSCQREQQLCLLLESMRADAHTIVLLGDMFDFWFTYRYVVPRGHVRLLGKLASLADDGIELHFFLGNHDMWVFDYLESEMAITMHSDQEVFDFDGHRFLIGHGDGLGHLDKRYDFLRRVFRSRLNQRLFAMLPSRLTFGIATRWSRQSRVSHGGETSQYLGDEREGIVIYCRQRLEGEKIDYCVFGHRHTPLQRTISAENGNSALYVNVGDWLNHRTYAVYSHEEGLQLREWCE